ncbi:hypothetical protein BDM02DRAFT_3187992 [Thelephora ganbajun]|uniref:Uncharacterized protein n=1 Tax=Thelephora ganbajun TaxID=370292 RepID=A0ACB6ZCR5_THEGA|nr:hypothetical protein BDM02DRAFT_3187992 [Thelephora ganbajun]
MALFSWELTPLRYDLGHLEAFALDSATADRAFNLVETTADFFDEESKRKAVLRPILGGLLVDKSQCRRTGLDRAPFGLHASDRVLHIARCAERLRNLYRNPKISTDTTHRPMLYGRTLQPIRLSPPKGLKNSRMRTKGGTLTADVLVKFAVKYNEAVHHIPANHNPPLLIGDVFMVVTQHVSNSEGVPFYNALLSPPPNLGTTRRDVSRALELLHVQNQQAGHDSCPASTERSVPGGHRKQGFDGVGRDGEDRHSAQLNSEAGLGVARLQITENSHDVENFGSFIDRLSGEL